MTWENGIGLLSIILNFLLASGILKRTRIIRAVVAGVEASKNDDVKASIQKEATAKGVEVKLAKIVKAVTE